MSTDSSLSVLESNCLAAAETAAIEAIEASTEAASETAIETDAIEAIEASTEASTEAAIETIEVELATVQIGIEFELADEQVVATIEIGTEAGHSKAGIGQVEAEIQAVVKSIEPAHASELAETV